MQPILDVAEELAKKAKCTDFDLDDLKTKASALPDVTVDGLKKFVDAGFGTLNKLKSGDKRKSGGRNNNTKPPQAKKTKVRLDIEEM